MSTPDRAATVCNDCLVSTSGRCWRHTTTIVASVQPMPDPYKVAKCEHDWRVNPHVTLTSNPPMRQVVCAKCSASKYEVIEIPTYGYNPSDWPRAEGRTD